MKALYDLLRQLNPDLKINLDKSFILSAKKTLTYNSVIQSCSNSAEKLKQIGVEKNSLVPILIDNSPDFILAVLSLWMLEAIPVPINTKLSLPEIKNQIAVLKCKHILVNSNYKNKLDMISVQQIHFETTQQQHQNTRLEFDYYEQRTAVVLFTSGSSGKPKAVELSFSNLIHSARIGNEYLKQTTDDRWLASLPFYHIGGFSIIFRALMFGTQLILPGDLKTNSLQSIVQHKETFEHSSIHSFSPTLVSLVSSQMSELLNSNIHPNKDLRHVLLGGGFIDSSIIKEALAKGWKVSKVYGSTETSSFVTVLSPEEFKSKPESAGKPIPPNEILIINENGEEVPPTTEGEIAVKSPALMKGYLNDDETTKQKLKNDLYYTGDMGYKDSDGFLYVVNRRSDLIVTGGENVNPLEVEEAILKFSQVKEVCVFGIDDGKWGQKVAAAIVPKPNEKISLEDLKDFLKDKIAKFKIPKEIYFVDELPKTELGKVKRDNLKQLIQ